MSQPRLVLASGSPRRQQLLEEAGYTFEVVPARDGVEEAGMGAQLGPAELVVDLASRKLNDVVTQVVGAEPPRGTATLVLAADTVAECDGAILGKPVDPEHAREMMRRLSGRSHAVFTGVALARLLRGSVETMFAEAHETTLQMDKLSAEWIEQYVASDAWRGKAGGFGYQDGLGFVHVTKGSESNVVGLPMEFVRKKLADLGCVPADGQSH